MVQEQNMSLARENTELKQQVHHLQTQLSALRLTGQRQRHEETRRILAHLVERLAHRIKNPMTAIGTFLQMLPDRYNDAAFRNEYLGIALEEYYRIDKLIDALLDLVDDRPLHYTRINMSALIDRCIRKISDQSRRQSMAIERILPESPLTACADEERIDATVSHLLANAIEASPPGGRIRVAAEMIRDQRDDTTIRIVISDTGPGISEDIVDRIFTPFVTSKHASARTPCTGFGLFIAQKNMLAHGGGITLDTAPGKGTRVTLRLPAFGSVSSNGNHRPCGSDL